MGAKRRPRSGSASRPACFNPHPFKQAGATPGAASGAAPEHQVSILTHSSKWVRRARYGSKIGAMNGQFQSSPTQANGCDAPSLPRKTSLAWVSILTPLKQVGATPCGAGASAAPSRCFNPHPPRQVGATAAHTTTIAAPAFQSSPTLGKWVRHLKPVWVEPHILVSILTHLGKWVRRAPRPTAG